MKYAESSRHTFHIVVRNQKRFQMLLNINQRRTQRTTAAHVFYFRPGKVIFRFFSTSSYSQLHAS